MIQINIEKIGFAVLSAIFGGIVTFILDRVRNRRARFTYRFEINHVLKKSDPITNVNLQATWAGNQIESLYAWKIEVTNESNKDFSDVPVRVLSGVHDMILNDFARTCRLGDRINYSNDFQQKIAYTDANPTQQQMEFYSKRREYSIPTWNRGETIYIEGLSTVITQGQTPWLFVEVPKAGINCTWKVNVEQKFLDVPLSRVLPRALVILAIVYIIASIYIINPWLVGALIIFTNFIAQFIAAYLVKWQDALLKKLS